MRKGKSFVKTRGRGVDPGSQHTDSYGRKDSEVREEEQCGGNIKDKEQV